MIKIPTVLGLVVILTILIVALMYQIYQQQLTTKAQADFEPQNIQITNIADNSFSVTWQSKQKTVGSIAWGDNDQLGTKADDDRDRNQPTTRYTHHVTIQNLQPETEYFLKVRNGPYFYPSQPIIVKTTARMSRSLASPIIGTVLDANRQPLNDGIAFLTTDNAALLSAPVGKLGSYVIPLVSLKNNQLNSPITLTTPQSAIVEIVQGNLKSEINLQIPTDQPLPLLVLGENLTIE